MNEKENLTLKPRPRQARLVDGAKEQDWRPPKYAATKRVRVRKAALEH